MTVLRKIRGFTLIEVMVAVAIVSLIASLAVPSYTDYLRRSRVPNALSALSSVSARMEQYYQDNASYGAGGCGGTMSMPTADKFTVTCVLTNGGQGYTATATGASGSLVQGYTYTIDSTGARVTTAHPKGASLPMNCWTIKGTSCDA